MMPTTEHSQIVYIYMLASSIKLSFRLLIVKYPFFRELFSEVKEVRLCSALKQQFKKFVDREMFS